MIRNNVWTVILGMVTAGLLGGSMVMSEENVRDGTVIRFGIVTDAHYADAEPRGNRIYREAVAKMSECVDVMNSKKVDFLVELGDLKDQGTPAVEADTLVFLKTIEEKLAKFAGPRYHVLGNHDMDSISKDAFLKAVENTGVTGGKSFYSFVRKGVQFIVLDANFNKDGTPYERGNFDWKYACIPGEQLDWLKKELAGHGGKSIVFVHQRLDVDGNVHCVQNAAEVRKMLVESGKVLAVFSGHDHAGSYKKLDGIHYYTLKALVCGTGKENNAYAIVEVNGDFTLNIEAFGKVASTLLK